ncbi:MAG: hypothetical protein ABIQ88_19085 [Chitinophagaceae bacterium]
MAKAVKAPAKKAIPAKNVSTAAASKKAGISKSETGIKYADKSGGQPHLVLIFNEIKKLLLPYEKGSIKLRGGTGGQILLVSDKPVTIHGKIRDELWFAAALIQKGYVGFYFMPVYTGPEIKEVFKPELLKCLKGKSCFHIKKQDEEILKQIKESLAIGYRKYKEKGWL